MAWADQRERELEGPAPTNGRRRGWWSFQVLGGVPLGRAWSKRPERTRVCLRCPHRPISFVLQPRPCSTLRSACAEVRAARPCSAALLSSVCIDGIGISCGSLVFRVISSDQMFEKRAGDSAHLSSSGTAPGSSQSDCVPGVPSAGHAQAALAGPCFRA